MINKSVAFQNCLFRSSVGVDKTSTALGKSEIIQFADLWCPHNDLGWFWYILERFSWDNPEFWCWESTSFTKSEPLLPSLAEAQGLSFFEFGLESFFKRIFRVPTFWEKLLREARTVQNIRILKTDFFLHSIADGWYPGLRRERSHSRRASFSFSESYMQLHKFLSANFTAINCSILPGNPQ